MRPSPIATFERVVLLMLVLGIANTVLNWSRVEAMATARGLDSSVLLAVYAAAIALFLLLVWFVARKGSNVARWIYAVIIVAALALEAVGIVQGVELPAPALIASMAQWVLALLSLWLLFRPDAGSWFARRSA